MKCDICGCEKTYIKEYEHNYTVKGKNILFVSKRKFCKSCNNLVYDSKLDNDASLIAITKYNELYGISKDEIIQLRKKYNLSQELFSKIIGCAKKTLISYEKGKSIPNDSYLIILKSLMAKPDTIVTIIEANKEQFSTKEYEKLNEKISKVLPNNIKNLISDLDFVPNEYNGYSNFSKEKIFNIILFFSNKVINKTKLLKEMFYADFVYFKNNCKSITGLEYAKLPYGPVPDRFEIILSECFNNKLIDYEYEFNGKYECYNITAIKEFNESIFEKEELDTLRTIKDKFKDFGSKEIADYSHNEKAYIVTNLGDRISYEYAFDINSI